MPYKKDYGFKFKVDHNLSQDQISKFEQDIIDNKDSEYAYRFAIYIKGADLNKLQRIIIDNKDSCFSYFLASTSTPLMWSICHSP